MASVLKLRRGNRIQNNVFTGAEGELSYDSTAKKIRVHDGITLGGKMLASEIVSVKDFGAVGNGVADDTAAIQNALNAARVVTFPAGEYLVTKPILVNSYNYLVGSGGTIEAPDLYKLTNGSVFYINGVQNQKHDIKFIGLTFNATIGNFAQHCHVIKVHGVTGLEIAGCKFYGWCGDAIYMPGQDGVTPENHNYNVSIHNNEFNGADYNNRQAITINDCVGFSINDNYYTRCSRSDMPGPIDCEPDYTNTVLENGIISGNKFVAVGGNVGCIGLIFGVGPTNFPNNIVISNNIQTGSTRPGTQFISFIGDVPISTKPFVSILGNDSDKGIVFGAGLQRNIIISNNNIDAVTVYNNTGLEDIKCTDNNFHVFSIQNTVCNRMLFSGNTITQQPGNTSTVVCNIKGTNLTVINNTVTTNQYGIIGISMISPSGSAGALTNIFTGNKTDKRNTIHAAITDDTTEFNSNVAISFNTQTLPSQFPTGISTAYLNGDTGVPAGIGSTQGLLTNYKTSPTAQTWYQQFVPYSIASSGYNGNFYQRYRDQNSDSWTTWYKFSGSAVI